MAKRAKTTDTGARAKRAHPLRVRRPTPHARGFRWPAEWARHEATWLSWPHDPTTWPDCLEAAETAFALLIAAIGQGEAVHVLVKDAAVAKRARTALDGVQAKRVTLHRVATADAWLRDCGPIVVKNGAERLALDFIFTAWGGKYDELLSDDGLARKLAARHALPRVRMAMALEGGAIDGNGRGSILTTEQCLLNPNRNPDLNRAEVEWNLRETLGAKQVLWLGEGIAGDDTDGHVDDITRFVSTTRIVTAVERRRTDENFAPLDDNLRRLQAMVDPQGRAFEIIELPMPNPVYAQAGHRLPASYANFYIANKTVSVPVFGHKQDKQALRILRACFPRRQIVPIRCEHLVEGLGALHCVTQQLPR